jgi:hypothetical protein
MFGALILSLAQPADMPSATIAAEANYMECTEAVTTAFGNMDEPVESVVEDVLNFCLHRESEYRSVIANEVPHPSADNLDERVEALRFRARPSIRARILDLRRRHQEGR